MMLPLILGRALVSLGAAAARGGARGGRLAAKVIIDAAKAKRKFEKMNEIPEDVLQEGYRVFHEETPIRSGNARSKTKLDKKNKSIKAEYPYAQRLDDGYSKQSPDGMSEPAKKAMGKYADQVAMKINRE